MVGAPGIGSSLARELARTAAASWLALPVAVMALLAHELAHLVLVRALGGGIDGLRISFLGAAAWVRGLEKLKLWQRYAVYLAGPAANALFAVGAWAAARFLCADIGLETGPGRARMAPALGVALMALGLVQAVLYPWNITLLCAGVYIRRRNKRLYPQLYWECIKALQAKAIRRLPTRKIILPKHTTPKQAVEYLG